MAPWGRTEPSDKAIQLIVGNDAISLLAPYIELNKTTGGPYAVTLPVGGDCVAFNEITIYVPKANENNTATFVVTGTLVGYTTITFNNVGFLAKLVWLGGGWQWSSGNALLA